MAAELKIKRKITGVLKNYREMSEAEVESVWDEAVAFMETLPESERGSFYWESGMEALFLVAPASGEKK